MASNNRRPDRVAEAIRVEVATFLSQDVKDPRIVGLVTVTGVDVSRDLRVATVFVSIYGSDSERAATTETDGLLLVDKTAGMTSHDVVAVARRSLRTRRVGHTGTLDPFATGLLVLLVGKATRLAPYVEGEPKVYEASIAFGAQTATDDCTGAIVRVAPVPSAVDVDHAIIRLTGTIDQRPPDYSAKKIQGVRAYAAARSGAPLVLDPVIVTVHSWRIRNRSPDALHVSMSCSAGSSVRAFA